ncbi:MAG: hypothetical protein ACTSSF_09700, partial [Candidatus Heimdallarchaeaceae archaeon]
MTISENKKKREKKSFKNEMLKRERKEDMIITGKHWAGRSVGRSFRLHKMENQLQEPKRPRVQDLISYVE